MTVTAVMPDGTRYEAVFTDFMAIAILEGACKRAWPEQCRDRAAGEAAFQASQRLLQR